MDWETQTLLGIDLGTTFTALARWHQNRMNSEARVTRQGTYTLQSAVYIDDRNGEVLVGQHAYNKGLINPENMVIGVKRMMDDATQIINVGGRVYTPIDISAIILERIYSDEAYRYPNGMYNSLGSVVTVPYYFKAHQCENTRQAAEIANINCRWIIQEPIAASLQYVWQLVQAEPRATNRETILVFDLGGGTFDLTLFSLEQNPSQLYFEVLATGGNDRLGGMDFSKDLGQFIIDKAGIDLDGLDAKAHRAADLKLYNAAENAKITLAQETTAFVIIPDILPNQHVDIQVSIDDIEKVMEPYLEQIDHITQKVLLTANTPKENVGRIIMVGGSSKLVCVQKLLEKIFGADKIWRNTNPDLCIAEGAALYAAFMDDPSLLGREVKIVTRSCHSLGVRTLGDRFDVVIPANSPTPCERTRSFTTDRDNATELDIDVYQGSGHYVSSCSKIGTLKITGIPPMARLRSNINVTFSIGEEQRLSVCVDVAGMTHSGTFTYV